MKKKKKAFITASDLNAEKKRINLTLGIDMVEKLIGIGNQLYPSINPTTVATLILCSSICDLHGKCKGDRKSVV